VELEPENKTFLREIQKMKQWEKEEDKKKLLAPNIKELINRFNVVAFWVTSMILKTPKIDDRAKVVTTLIKVAEV